MGTVTIAATYGAGGSVIGPAVATRLGLPFVDRAIPSSVVKKIHEPLTTVLTDDSIRRNDVGRLLNSVLSCTGLFAGVPLSDEHRGIAHDVAETEVAMRKLADAEGAVILGRAGVFVLKDRTDVFHVRLDGALEARLRAAMEHEHLDHDAAARNQHEIDHARRAYIAHFYPRCAWADPRHYHMVLDSTAISSDACVGIIARAARDFFAKTAVKAETDE